VGLAIPNVLARYHGALIEWGEEYERASTSEPGRGGHEFGKAEAFFEPLRDDPDGREGIRKESSSNPDQFQKSALARARRSERALSTISSLLNPRDP
jgi:hypothetical protein